MNRPLKENETRRLLSRAWSLRPPRAAAVSVRNAIHLDLNRELEGESAQSIKYFFAVLLLQGLLYLVYSRLGIS